MSIVEAQTSRKRAASQVRNQQTSRRLNEQIASQRYSAAFDARRAWVLGELAAMRVPNLAQLVERKSPTFAEAASRWQAARVDVAASTAVQHRIQLDKLIPLVGKRRLDALAAAEFIDA